MMVDLFDLASRAFHTDLLGLASLAFPADVLATRGDELLADARANADNGSSPIREAFGLLRGGVRLRRYSQPSFGDTLLCGLWIALVCELMFTSLYAAFWDTVNPHQPYFLGDARLRNLLVPLAAVTLIAVRRRWSYLLAAVVLVGMAIPANQNVAHVATTQMRWNYLLLNLVPLVVLAVLKARPPRSSWGVAAILVGGFVGTMPHLTILSVAVALAICVMLLASPTGAAALLLFSLIHTLAVVTEGASVPYVVLSVAVVLVLLAGNEWRRRRLVLI